jgi:alanine dehydrogenase
MPPRENGLTLGLPRMLCEPGEKRDFLPSFVGEVTGLGVRVCVESGLGSGMRFSDQDYTAVGPGVRVVDRATAYAQEIVLVLRCPETTEWTLIRQGNTLMSMLHFPTRPNRVQKLAQLRLEALSLDSIVDDDGQRLVENLSDVAWNGVKAAFDTLGNTYEALAQTDRPPVRVTVLGSGRVGKHAVEAAVKYGDLDRNRDFGARGLPGVEVVTVGRNLSSRWNYMRDRLMMTDILVDATYRPEGSSEPVVPNSWIAWLPEHAVLCDLNVDPYQLDANPPTVRSIEGIPAGNLDQYVFSPHDPAWNRTIPKGIPTAHRRTVVSCYSWPGVYPEPCMERYGRQLVPLFEALVSRGGTRGLRSDGGFFERALWRSSLRRWTNGRAGAVSGKG